MTNFAQGSLGMFNAFIATYFLMFTGSPVWLAAIIGMVTGFGFGGGPALLRSGGDLTVRSGAGDGALGILAWDLDGKGA